MPKTKTTTLSVITCLSFFVVVNLVQAITFQEIYQYQTTGQVLGSTIVSDNFNRANETPLAAPWAKILSTAGTLNIAGNVVVASNSNIDAQYYYTGITVGPDEFSQAAISVSGGNSSDVGYGVAVRTSLGTAKTYYRLVVNKLASNNIELGKFINGTYTMLTRRTTSWTDGDVLRLEVAGSTLKIYQNSTQLGADVTDASISSGGVGIAYSAQVSGGSIDNWSGGDLTSGGDFG